MSNILGGKLLITIAKYNQESQPIKVRKNKSFYFTSFYFAGRKTEQSQRHFTKKMLDALKCN